MSDAIKAEIKKLEDRQIATSKSARRIVVNCTNST
jgi:hypothetical protein